MFTRPPSRTLSPPGATALRSVAREVGPSYRSRPDVEDRLTQLVDQLCAPERLAALPADDLEHQVDLARKLEGAAALLTARTLRELRQRSDRRDAGSTEWLKSTGRSGKEAARAARLASSLEDLPATAEALAEGRIGPEAADAIVHAARGLALGPPSEVEDELLPLAGTASPETLRAEVRRREQQAEPDAMLRDEQRQHARRRLSLVRREDGMWNLHGQLSGEAGSRLRTWLDAHDHRDPEDTPPDQRRRPEQRLADALDTAVTSALDAGVAPQNGGVARPHLSVVVDVRTFDADLADPGEPHRPVRPDHPLWTELSGGSDEWGGTLSPQAVRRLCCDASISRIVMDGPSQVLDVGRATREWSASQRRGIRVRDRHCRGPHCTRPIGWTEVHHLQWWRHGGHTAIDNGLSLCRSCHRLVHDDGWHVELDPVTGAATWTSPDRRRTVVTHPRPAA